MRILLTGFLAVILVFKLNARDKEEEKFNEKFRPQFHFTPEQNWHNDPNGLVYYDGEYHLFYQYNPSGNEWGFMHWGHAVSTDLLHWEHSPIALYPDNDSKDKEFCTAFSGSAIVDEHNLLKKQADDVKTLVAFYTSQQCGQRLAYSTDKGRTWIKLESNPIIPFDEKDDARDPKVIWHEESQKWVMVLYRKQTEDEKSKGISFYTSENLIDWHWKSHINGFFECPDLVKLQVTNRPEEYKWVLFDGDGSYFIGAFNGEEFTPESAKIKSDMGANYYATQTWSNIPALDGRTIQIAWMRGGEFPGMPFNGQMSIPSEISLTKFSFGYKLVRTPVKELETLQEKHQHWEDKVLIPGINENKTKSVKGDCFRIVGEFELKTADSFGFLIRHGKKISGTEIQYNVKRGILTVLNSSVPVTPVDNKLKLEILIDRSSIEIFANDGQTVISNCFTPGEGEDMILYTIGGELGVVKLDVYELKSIYKEEKK